MSVSTSRTDRTGDALRRIADLLGEPAGVFHEAAGRQGDTRTDTPSADAQRAELIALYDALRDPQSKRLSVDCVRSLLESERKATT